MGGQKQLETIKKEIKKIKAQVKQCSVQEKLLYNSLFSFRVSLSKENTRHHLFDSLEGEAGGEGGQVGSSSKRGESGLPISGPVKEFTEEDLNVEES